MLSEMGFLKSIVNFLDIFFITIWGFTVIDIMPLLVVKGGYDIFHSVDSSIKVASAFVGLIYFLVRIYVYYHKSKNELLIQKQHIRKMEIANNNDDMKNYIFRGQIAEIPKEEFEESERRLIKKD